MFRIVYVERFSKGIFIDLARESIFSELTNRELSVSCPDDKIYHQKSGGFVTLHKNGQSRGCTGYVIAEKPLLETIKEIAVAAAFEDPRFPSLGKSEFEKIDIEISVLSELIPVNSIEEIEIG